MILCIAIAYGTVGVGVGAFALLTALINGKSWHEALPAAILAAWFWPAVLWVEFRRSVWP